MVAGVGVDCDAGSVVEAGVERSLPVPRLWLSPDVESEADRQPVTPMSTTSSAVNSSKRLIHSPQGKVMIMLLQLF